MIDAMISTPAVHSSVPRRAEYRLSPLLTGTVRTCGRCTNWIGRRRKMPLLPLAVEIAEKVVIAADAETPLDAVAAADHLFAAHPEADVSRADVLDAVIFVANDAGVTTTFEDG